MSIALLAILLGILGSAIASIGVVGVLSVVNFLQHRSGTHEPVSLVALDLTLRSLGFRGVATNLPISAERLSALQPVLHLFAGLSVAGVMIVALGLVFSRLGRKTVGSQLVSATVCVLAVLGTGLGSGAALQRDWYDIPTLSALIIPADLDSAIKAQPSLALTEVAPTATPVPPTATSIPTAAPISAADVAERVGRSVVLIKNGDISGSGVKITQGILTNAHVVGDSTQVLVVTQSGETALGAVVRRDSTIDLALILTELAIPSVDWEPSFLQRQGDTILVLGFPRPDAIGGQVTLTRGLISAFRNDPDNHRLLIQTDAAINPGNSGGPMINLRGHLIGLVTEQLRDSHGLSFGVASETMILFLTSPIPTPLPTPLPTVLPSPTPRLVRSDAREVVIRISDLGVGWEDLGPSDDTAHLATSGFTTYVSGRTNGVISQADVLTNLDEARGVYVLGVNRNNANMRQLAAPGMCDQSAAWSGTTAIGTPKIVIECVVENVILDATVSGDYSWATVKNAEAAVSIMLGRLQY